MNGRLTFALLVGALYSGQVPCSAQPAPDTPREWNVKSRGVSADNTERPLRYHPEGTDFVIENGPEFFNRPLYCCNTACRVDGGDKPEFSFYLPGRGGNLRFGIKTAAGVKWFHAADRIVTRYRPGSLLYKIDDSLVGDAALRLTALPLGAQKGLVVQIERTGTAKSMELIWAFGGANGMRGARAGDIGCEREPVSRFFQLRPEQCAGSSFTIGANNFVLRSKTARIAGQSSIAAEMALCDATKWNDLSALLASAGAETKTPVLVGSGELHTNDTFYLVLEVEAVGPDTEASGTGTTNFAGETLSKLFEEAEQRRRSIAERVLVETPDPFINAAAAAINVAGDAIWDEAQGVYMHGAVAWRTKLLGWRGPYTGDALGQHDRARRHFSYWAGRQNTNAVPDAMPSADPKVNLSRNELALHSNGDLSNSHYDMNLVYIDALFRHLLWTGDREFARQVWPVIERHLAWERRLFRRTFGPEQLPLYEAYAAIWASDNMQYDGGGVAYTSAYNYYHNKMAARVAKLLGHDATPYEREAGLIAKAMRQYLWLGDGGWFAESKDSLGLQLAHPSAGLWTFYHTLDSEVPTATEAWEMTRFVDTQIAHIPIHGPGVPKGDYYTLPTTSWMPYMWSLNNVVMAEAAHTSLAYWQTGRSDAAFSLFKGCLLDSMYLGLCPGNVGAMTYFDMARHEAQRDFGDAVGVCSRTMVEGLFGVHPDALAGELQVRPGFPADWNYAKMRHPDFNFGFRREGKTETYLLESLFPGPMKVRWRVPALRAEVGSVTVNGQPAKWRVVEDSIGCPRLEIESAAGPRVEVVIKWKASTLLKWRMGSVNLEALASARQRLGLRRPSAASESRAAVRKAPEGWRSPKPDGISDDSGKGDQPATTDAAAVVAAGEDLHADFSPARIRQVVDPEGVLSNLTVQSDTFRAVASGASGHRTVFAKLEQGDLTWWQPVAFEIRPEYEVLGSAAQDANHLRFRIRNNSPEAFDREATIRVGNHSTPMRLRIQAYAESPELALPADGFLPGSNPVAVDLMGGKSIHGIVINWKLHADTRTAKLEPVNLEPLLYDHITQIFRNEYLSPRSQFCSLALPKEGIGGWCDYALTVDVDDAGLCKAGEAGGQFVLPQGVPFATPVGAEAKNIVFTSQWDNYPREASVPLNGRAARVYLLMAGSSNPMQSQFDNGEVVVTYSDGSTERLALRNPTNWWPIDQDYFIDDFGFRRPEPIPPRVDLKTGKVRVLDAADFKGQGGKVPGGAATVLDLPLNPQKTLKSLKVHALANEVVIGLMAVTLAR